jgi:hypothetical protein
MNRHQRRAQGEPSKAEFERIADRIETAGCSYCGLRFGTRMPYVVGRTRTVWVGHCMRLDCNSDFLPTGPSFIGTGIFAGDPWTEDDRDWFRANPKRTWSPGANAAQSAQMPRRIEAMAMLVRRDAP